MTDDGLLAQWRLTEAGGQGQNRSNDDLMMVAAISHQSIFGDATFLLSAPWSYRLARVVLDKTMSHLIILSVLYGP